MAELILYNYFRSSTSYRVRIALHLKNLAFEYRPIHLLQSGGEQYQESYKKLNPQSEVPTLVHKSKPISQSMAIIEYLDEIHPTPPLFPDDPYLRGRVRQFCENINSYLHPLSNLKVLKKLEGDHGYSQSQKEAWVQYWSRSGLQALEELVSESQNFCFGSQVTAADLFLVPALFSARRFKVDLDTFPKLISIESSLNQISAFKLAHPLRQIDTPENERLP